MRLAFPFASFFLFCFLLSLSLLFHSTPCPWPGLLADIISHQWLLTRICTISLQAYSLSLSLSLSLSVLRFLRKQTGLLCPFDHLSHFAFDPSSCVRARRKKKRERERERERERSERSPKASQASLSPFFLSCLDTRLQMDSTLPMINSMKKELLMALTQTRRRSETERERRHNFLLFPWLPSVGSLYRSFVTALCFLDRWKSCNEFDSSMNSQCEDWK